MARACSTSVARIMGYMSTPSQEETVFVISSAREGKISSYHSGGVSAKDVFLKGRRAFKDAIGEVKDRKRKKVLYAR